MLLYHIMNFFLGEGAVGPGTPSNPPLLAPPPLAAGLQYSCIVIDIFIGRKGGF